jgi:multiple sugar transport system substrate-binding protein
MSAKRTFSRRGFLQASALTAAGGLLAACGAAPTPAPTSAPVIQTVVVNQTSVVQQTVEVIKQVEITSTPAPAAPTAVPITTLTFMRPDRAVENEVDQANVAAFNKKMEADGKPWRVQMLMGAATDNDYRAKMTIDAAAGNLADIAAVNGSDFADYVAAGYLLDLKPYFDKWPDWANYYDVLKPFAVVGGKTVGVPSASTFTFFVRKDVLTTAGLPTDQPKTWDDFYKACDAIKGKGIIPCGIPAATPWGGGTFDEGFRMVWLSFNGTIYDTSDNKWVVSSPNLLKALQVYETLAKNKYLDVQNLLSPNPWQPIKYQEFPQGKLAIVTGGDWQWTFDWGPKGATPIDGLFDKVMRWQFPSEDGKPFTYVDGQPGNAVSAKTSAPDGAAEFIEFTSGAQQVCAAMDIYIGGPSGRKDLPDVCPKYKTIVGGKYFEASGFFDTGLHYNFNQIGRERIVDGIAKATEAVITLKQTPQQAMDAFATSMMTQIPDNAKKA